MSGLFGLFNPYIKEEWKENIKNYKFHSTDNSILYVYITSPLCNYLVKFIPPYIAPNLVTLFGLFCVIIINVLCGIFGGLSSKGDIPGWVCIMTGLLYVCYHLIDLSDGKHARNTKNSSPLGLLMDHGCDALTTFLFLMSMANILKLDNPFQLSACWYIAGVTFFFCTLEEYHLDRLDFPCFHGVSEGTVIAALVCIFTGAIGQDFWIKEITIFGINTQYNLITLYSFLFFSMLFTLLSIHKMAVNPQVKVLDMMYHSIVFVFLIANMLFFITFTENVEGSYTSKYPKLIIYTYGFIFAKLLSLLQLGHLAKAEFMQFRVSILFCLFFPSIMALLNFYLEFMDINIIIVFNLVLSFIVWLHFSYKISGELCSLLNINRFTVKVAEKLNDKDKLITP